MGPAPRSTWTSGKASSCRSWGRPGRENRRCCMCSGCTTRHGRASTVLDGHPVHKLNRKDRLELQKRHIGFVFQSYHLLDRLTVYENLDIPLSYRNVKKAGARQHCLRHARPVQMVGEEGSLSESAFGRAAAACGGGPRAGGEAEDHSRGRADGQPPLLAGKEIMELFRRLNRRKESRSSGDALGSERFVWRPDDSDRGWVDYERRCIGGCLKQ